MVAKKLSFKGFNLGKAVTLSLYLTTSSSPFHNEDLSYAAISSTQTPWKTIRIPATGRLDKELTWTGRLGFVETGVDGAGGETKTTYLADFRQPDMGSVAQFVFAKDRPADLLAYAFTEPNISPLLMQTINDNERPTRISLGLTEAVDGLKATDIHPILTFQNTKDGFLVQDNPVRRVLNVYALPTDPQEAAPGGPGCCPTKPIWTFDMLSLGPSAGIQIQYDTTKGEVTASLDASITQSIPGSGKTLPGPKPKGGDGNGKDEDKSADNQGA